jgi:DNA-directed RNA polymerase alpha subunit
MVAKKGIGKTHAKWSPVSTCTMRKQPTVAFDQDTLNRVLSLQQKQVFVTKCPRKVFKLNNFKQTIEIENADNCSLCQECTKYSREVGLPAKTVLIGENDDKFIFTVEGTGALSPEDIVLRSIKILHGKLSFLADAMQPKLRF